MDRFRMLPSYHYEDSSDGVLKKSAGKPLRDYRIEGSSIQDGTPTPDNPIEIQSVGEYDEATGKYKIPIVVSNEEMTKVYNIFLDEPLRKVGDYVDCIDLKNKKLTRHIKELILNNKNEGGGNWRRATFSTGKVHFDLWINGVKIETPVLCEFSKDVGSQSYYLLAQKNGCCINPTAKYFYFSDDTITTDLDEFKAWLAEHQPKMQYVLNTPTEIAIELPEIVTNKGSNIITVDTAIQPSSANYQYYKGGK